MCCVKWSSVINSIYSGQEFFCCCFVSPEFVLLGDCVPLQHFIKVWFESERVWNFSPAAVLMFGI
jgi:hypothetical protein